MKPASVQSYFQQLAAMGDEPRLRDTVGTCEFEIAGAGTWCVEIDHGHVRVVPGSAEAAPLGRLRGDASSFLHVVRGDDDDNFVSALLRGAISVDGDLGFLQKLRVLTFSGGGR
jgi:hypothetical protein